MIRGAFDKLDETDPYDNGLTAKDVDHADVLAWREDGTIILAMCDRKGNIVAISKVKIREGGDRKWQSRKNLLNPNVFMD